MDEALAADRVPPEGRRLSSARLTVVSRSSEALRALAAQNRALHVGIAFSVLKETLLRLPLSWAGGEARRLHLVHRNDLRAVFLNHPGLAQTVINFRAKVPTLSER